MKPSCAQHGPPAAPSMGSGAEHGGEGMGVSPHFRVSLESDPVALRHAGVGEAAHAGRVAGVEVGVGAYCRELWSRG